MVKMRLNKIILGVGKGQRKFAEDIAVIVNSILLSIVYFLGVGITFLFSRLVGKRFLDLKIDKNTDSYWEDLNLSKNKMEEYFRQF